MRGIRGVRIAKEVSKVAEKKVQKEEQKPEPKVEGKAQPRLGESIFGVTSVSTLR